MTYAEDAFQAAIAQLNTSLSEDEVARCQRLWYEAWRTCESRIHATSIRPGPPADEDHLTFNLDDVFDEPPPPRESQPDVIVPVDPHGFLKTLRQLHQATVSIPTQTLISLLEGIEQDLSQLRVELWTNSTALEKVADWLIAHGLFRVDYRGSSENFAQDVIDAFELLVSKILTPRLEKLGHPGQIDELIAERSVLQAIIHRYEAEEPVARVEENHRITWLTANNLVGKSLYARHDRNAYQPHQNVVDEAVVLTIPHLPE